MKPFSTTPVNLFLFRLSLLSLALFTATALFVFLVADPRMDEAVLQSFQGKKGSSFTSFMLFITFLGKHHFLIPANLALILFFLIAKNNEWALRVAIVSTGGVLLMGLLKNLFGRQRPPAPLVEGITNNSFPSGHAMMGAAFYGLLAVLCFIIIKNKWLKNGLITLLLLFLLLIGFSRIYLRVHYITDVIAGYSLGVFWLCIAMWIVNKVINRQPHQGL